MALKAAAASPSALVATSLRLTESFFRPVPSCSSETSESLPAYSSAESDSTETPTFCAIFAQAVGGVDGLFGHEGEAAEAGGASEGAELQAEAGSVGGKRLQTLLRRGDGGARFVLGGDDDLGLVVCHFVRLAAAHHPKNAVALVFRFLPGVFGRRFMPWHEVGVFEWRRIPALVHVGQRGRHDAEAGVLPQLAPGRSAILGPPQAVFLGGDAVRQFLQRAPEGSGQQQPEPKLGAAFLFLPQSPHRGRRAASPR